MAELLLFLERRRSNLSAIHCAEDSSRNKNLLVRKREQVRRPPRSIADDDRHRGSVRHVLEDGADGVGAALDHQADQGGGEVGREVLQDVGRVSEQPIKVSLSVFM